MERNWVATSSGIRWRHQTEYADGLYVRQFMPIAEYSFQIQSRHISQNDLIQEENVRLLLDHLLHEGNGLSHLALEIFDDESTDKADIFLCVQGIRKSPQKLFIMSDCSQLALLHLRPPSDIQIAGVLPAKLNPRKTPSLKQDRYDYA